MTNPRDCAKAAQELLGKLGAREASEPLAPPPEGWPLLGRRAQQGSARLVSPVRPCLEALGEFGRGEFGGAGGDHALPRPERPVVSNGRAPQPLLQLTGPPKPWLG